MAFGLLYPLSVLLLLLQILSFATIAQTYNNISLGSSLIAKDSNSVWKSPSEEFAFGFRKIGKDGFLLAIWFNKIPERTIVWSANGDNLVKKGSKVELTADGEFWLIDITTDKPIWRTDSADTGVVYAAMLDTGNFVLANRSSINLWESFGQPTDTILPTQILNQGSRLFARYTESNYSRGRFQLALDTDGSLSLYTTNYPLDSANYVYWPTNLEHIGYQVIFNKSGSIYLTNTDGSIVVMLLNNIDTVRMQDYYQRATLEYNGVMRHTVYPKTTSSSSVATGNKAWYSLSFIPSNICLSIHEYTGGGACGFNSLCRDDGDGPVCECPPGYNPTDPNDVLQGCTRNFISQSCDKASPESDHFEVQEMPNRDWPSGDYEHFESVQLDWCRRSCLDDCLCAVVIFDKGHCWKKRFPLSNGRFDSTIGSKALIKIRKDNSTYGRKHENSTLISPFLLGSLAFLNFLLLFMTCLLVSRVIHYGKAKVSDLYPVIQGTNLKCFTYTELKEATNGFKEELGHGAFAKVYKGVLASNNGKYVAVKRLDSMVRENDFEFKAEVSAIGGTNHKNLVKLLGFCNEGQHRILVYEFMTNGSLACFLFGETRPSWYQRSEIALGTARGLLYLHEECSNQIIHCDIKPQNILLDDSFTARIAAFGVAKLLKTDQTRTTTQFRGTKGYVAPEWFKSLPITVKADVYSFGILLLEIICCRKHYEAKIEDEDQMVLADWAYDCYKHEKLYMLLENDGHEAKTDIKKMEMHLMTAFWCIQEDPSRRPTMKNVTQMLEGTVEVLVPPNPSSLYVLSK